MHLLTVGLSHRTAPIELREKLAPHPGQIPDLLQQLIEVLSPHVNRQ